jgi:hypothetical protein
MTDLFRTDEQRAVDTARPACGAQRRADAPQRPNAPQRPCDIGLFSGDPAQTDIVDLAHKVTRDER